MTSSTNEQKIEAIREKCVAANPEKEWILGDERNYDAPARLADVLLAIKLSFDGGTLTGRLEETKQAIHDLADFRWNLRVDDLSLQSPETINFLFEILCN